MEKPKFFVLLQNTLFKKTKQNINDNKNNPVVQSSASGMMAWGIPWSHSHAKLVKIIKRQQLKVSGNGPGSCRKWKNIYSRKSIIAFKGKSMRSLNKVPLHPSYLLSQPDRKSTPDRCGQKHSLSLPTSPSQRTIFLSKKGHCHCSGI